ncbi:MAG TPA: hypothetical protein VHW60_16130 [Caulobacteraceae bacterium]|nr:hypothetical protein [Caulobacteraceae bacterium]
MASPSEAASPDSAPQELVADEVFVRAIDLPTLSLRQARAAVAQQIDILSPSPPGETAWSVVLLGPSEGGLNRFAVGFVRRQIIAELSPDGAAVRLTGRLDDQAIAFRFDGAGDADAPVDWLNIATLVGVCLAIVLAGANLRIDHELDQVQTRLDAAAGVVRQRAGAAADAARVLAAWRAVAATRKAGVVDCALGDLARVAGGPAKVAKLEFADGQATAWLSAPASDAAVAGLRALGAAPVVGAATDPAAAPTVQQFQIGLAACG